MDVAFRDVSLRRDGRTILDNVSFTTGGGDIFLVCGESGSGKTSLLRLVNRLDEPDGGEVLVNGRSVRDYPPFELRRQVGMIFQEPRLFDGTVNDNIVYGARYHGMSVDAAGLAASVGLQGKESRRVDSLSGGEQQRAAIARALAVRPSVLLMDEPTSSLDEDASMAIESLLREVAARGKLMIMFVTHRKDQLERLGGRGIVIAGGKVAERRG